MIAVVLVCIAAAGLAGAWLMLGRTTAELRVPKPLVTGVRISTAGLRGVWTAAAGVRTGRSAAGAEADGRAETLRATEHEVELAVRERLYGARRRRSDERSPGSER